LDELKPLSPSWDTFWPRAPSLNYLMFLYQGGLFVRDSWVHAESGVEWGFPTSFFHLEAPARSVWHPGTPEDPLEVRLFVCILHVVCCLSVAPLNLCLGFSILRLWICVLVCEFMPWFYGSEIVGSSPT
jgi:hypothetical protein